jgi:hypothetical protein
MLDMRYICVRNENLGISIRKKIGKGNFIIPAEAGQHDVLERGFHGLIYDDVLYPYRYKQEKIAGISGIKYKLAPPDPWLVTICAIMWQGLIQGLTWDLVKLAVLRGISVLRMNGLAPKEQDDEDGLAKKATSKKHTTRVGFSWTQFATDGKPMRELFLGIKREYLKKTKIERESIKNQYRPFIYVPKKKMKTLRSRKRTKLKSEK